jgi:predicted lipoprotein with Yx(FWY)xxD motif
MNAFIAPSPADTTVRAMRSHRITFLAPALALPMIALAIAGCGGGSDNATASPSSSSSSGATVDVSTVGGLGKLLVNSKGRTLYLFEKDKGPKSTCSGGCATSWPPFTTHGIPKAGSGTTAPLIGTSKRSDGTTQVTYNEHPLYYYAGDSNPGDTNGQNLDQFGAEWYVLSPAGKKVEGKATMASASTSLSNSRGY